MSGLFSELGHLVDSASGWAVVAAFVWGVLSVVLSPCHLASIPLIVGFIDGQGRISTKRAFLVSLLFSLGILVTIALVGVVTAVAGRMLGDLGRVGNYVVAAVFFLTGLHLLDVVHLPLPGVGKVGWTRKGLLPALALGLVFGLALGPCTFTFMAPLLALTFDLASTGIAFAVLLLSAYGIGSCGVIVLAGTFTGLIRNYLKWTERSKGATIVRRVCGVLVLAGGVYLIYSAR